MAITYLKKAAKTPQTGTDETRAIVADMLAKIEAGGEEAALAYGRDLDGYTGEAVVSAETIAAAGEKVSQQLKDDIQLPGPTKIRAGLPVNKPKAIEAIPCTPPKDKMVSAPHKFIAYKMAGFGPSSP